MKTKKNRGIIKLIEIIPVLDLKNHIAVSGKSGQRNTYTPLQTIYSPNPNPFDIAGNLKINNAKRVYIADLDLIEKQGHNIDQIKNTNMILPVILDAGVKNYESFKFYLNFAYKVIIATETLESIEELDKIFKTFPSERIIISVDVKDGKLFSQNLNMNLKEFQEILKKYDPSEIILLDISRVGTGEGFNKELLEKFKDFKDQIIIGGGIQAKDLQKLEELGFKKALVGTALHKGEIKINPF